MRAPVVVARLKAEPGFHVLLVPTVDPSIGALWVEVEEWGVCTSKSFSFDMFATGETVRLVPLRDGRAIESEGRAQIGGPFDPGVTADDAIAQMKKLGFIGEAKGGAS